MHEKFQELCAVASIGQAGPEDLALLEQHLQRCEECRRTYSEFKSIAAEEYALSFDEGLVAQNEIRQLPDADLLRERFLERAAENGIVLATRNGHVDTACPSSALQFPSDMAHGSTWKGSLYLLAAISLLSLGMLSGYTIGRRAGTADLAVTGNPNRDAPTTFPVPLAQLTDLNVTLEHEVAGVRRELEMARIKSRDTQEALSSLSEEKQVLSDKQKEQNEIIDRLQRKLEETETLLNTAKQETARLQATLGDAQASFVANQVRIRELSDQLTEKATDLNREEQLLQRDRDVRDLMVARNLHMYDVFDTDPGGKTSPAFGRIFYTEGKSLLFYAYDLNDVKVRNAEYHYRVWGAKEGQDDKATSLGIFYSDDKTQRRWVFKCDDPKVLSQIDSVFVTLERSGINISHPKGQKLLDAYLRGVPNHP